MYGEKLRFQKEGRKISGRFFNIKKDAFEHFEGKEKVFGSGVFEIRKVIGGYIVNKKNEKSF